MAPTYSGVLPTRAAVQCRRSSSAPPPAPPAPSCSLPPAAAPPSPPRPLIPPGLPPPSVCGGEGGALTGGRSGFPALGRAGGRFRRLRYGPAHVRHTWARLPAWLYKPCATLSRRFLLSEERPVRRAPAGRNATPLCARRTARTAGVPPGDKVAGRLATASRLVRPPRASGRVRRGRLTRSPLFPLCIALPQLLHSPMVAPRLRLGAGLCAGGAAQAPQQVKPEENPRLPKRLPRK